MQRKKIEEQIRENTKIAQEGVNGLLAQIDNLERVFEAQINLLSGEEKQQVQDLQASVNRVINLAKNGGDYKKALEDLKEKFL